MAISSQTHDGVTELLRMLRDEVAGYREREAEIVDEKEEDLPTISLDDQVVSDAWSVRRASDAESDEADDEDEKIEFTVTGAKIEKICSSD